MEQFTPIHWHECLPELQQLLANPDQYEIATLVPGFEAQVFKISAGDQQYVLKRWHAESRPDIELQYRVLSMLYKEQLAVSQVFGYGDDVEGRAILLTSYDGDPIRKITSPHLALLAQKLANLHELRPDELQGITVPTYDRKRYFLGGIENHPQLARAVDELLQGIRWRDYSIVHADYHLSNIVYNGEQYTIIDWTNIQQDDARMDLAWSLLLLELYVSARYERVFRQSYLATRPEAAEQLEECIAFVFVRWLMQYEKGHTPKLAAARGRARKLVQRNEWLQRHQSYLPAWLVEVQD